MDLYSSTSYDLSEKLTKRYSTSFSTSSRLFARSIRKHIYAIYGLVRIADEIVDTYSGNDAARHLERLKKDVYQAIKEGYSTNPIVHSFALTASSYGIGPELIDPFFESMAMDLEQKVFDQDLYERYIYGSAEVVGLMCLKVFVNGDTATYDFLVPGARALGAAYQKVNFLRDIAADYRDLGRVYFPNVDYKTFSERDKKRIVKDISADFTSAQTAIPHLPKNARKAVQASFDYYGELLEILKETPVAVIKSRRVRVPNRKKAVLFVKAVVSS